jgi:hypothetical protein
MITRQEAQIAHECLVEVYRQDGEHLGHIVRLDGDDAARIEWFGSGAPDTETVKLTDLQLTRSARQIVDNYLP